MKQLLYFDDDWNQVRDVLTAWWRHETPTRPAIAVTAPRAKPLPFAEPLVVASECRIVEIDLDSHRERLAIQRGGHTIP